MKKYFDDCSTEPEVKKRFRQLSKDHSPRTLDELADKKKSDIMQEINRQRTEALRRIAVSEGKAPSYYEELAAKAGKTDFFSSIVKAAKDIDAKLTKEGNNTTDFGEVFAAVSKIFFTPKKENAIENKNPGPLVIPPGPGLSSEGK